MKKKKFPLWAQVVAILLAGVIASGAVYLIVKDKTAERFTVTFAESNGEIIEQKEVKKGSGVFPPVLTNDGVFRGWSAGFNMVESDIEVHPIFYDIVEDNLFYFDSVYAKEGKSFTLDLYIAGNVNVSSGTIKLTFDPDVMKYKKAQSDDLCEIKEDKAGELTIGFSSKKAITKKTLLGEIMFYAKRADAYASEIQLSASDVILVANGKEQKADFATINNKIYFLQEVG